MQSIDVTYKQKRRAIMACSHGHILRVGRWLLAEIAELMPRAMKHRSSAMNNLLLLLLLVASAPGCSFLLVARASTPNHQANQTNSVAAARCIPSERDALLAFKRAITDDPAGRLASWREQDHDCCRWGGVRCSNVTGRVVGLYLGAPAAPCDDWGDDDQVLGTGSDDLDDPIFQCSGVAFLQGQVAAPLFSLRYLEHLDLSWNALDGVVPPQLGNLSNLEYLDLSNTEMHSSDISWIAHLPRLRYLDLGSVNLSTAYRWAHAVNMLPSLRVLGLSRCQLASANQPLPHLNLTKLERLDLSVNLFNHTVASCWFWGLTTSLKYLSLSTTTLSGRIPDALAAMTSLQVLDFSFSWFMNSVTMPPYLLRSLCSLEILNLAQSLASGNMTEFLESLQQNCSSHKKIQQLNLADNFINGTLPVGMSRLINLVTLQLQNNRITGLIPLEISMLTGLTVMVLGSNEFHGAITEEHFAGLQSLRMIDLSYNYHLEIAVGPEWLPPFIRLQEAYLAYCHMGPQFPSWMQRLPGIDKLDISSTGIADQFPYWFSTAFSKVTYLDISNNSISGGLPANMEIMSLKRLRLGSNQLTGPIPRLPVNLTLMDLSNNSLSGPLPSNFGAPSLRWVHLSSNNFSSHIPASICGLQELTILDLANNRLQGEFPQCPGKISQFFFLNALSQMTALILANNSLSGTFPSFLQGCTQLGLLDLSGNNFTGRLPIWIGDLMELRYLRLSNNLFYGNIPFTITNLGKLYDLNLAGNGLSGAIPCHLSNLTAMAGNGKNDDSGDQDWYVDGSLGLLPVTTKGQELYYYFSLSSMVSIDLSSNYLIGGISEEITSLRLVKNLNLSRNYLNGRIPHEIGFMQSLESLDLSSNKFSGEIPPSLSNISYLSYLNLSHNNLSGRIPAGSQLDTLYLEHPDMYSGNSGLCGPPLRINCSRGTAKGHGYGSPNRSAHMPEPVFFYLGLGSGSIVGLWVVFCILLFKKTWRIAYFLFFDKVYDTIYVFIVVTWAILARKTTAQ